MSYSARELREAMEKVVEIVKSKGVLRISRTTADLSCTLVAACDARLLKKSVFICTSYEIFKVFSSISTEPIDVVSYVSPEYFFSVTCTEKIRETLKKTSGYTGIVPENSVYLVSSFIICCDINEYIAIIRDIIAKLHVILKEFSGIYANDRSKN